MSKNRYYRYLGFSFSSCSQLFVYFATLQLNFPWLFKYSSLVLDFEYILQTNIYLVCSILPIYDSDFSPTNSDIHFSLLSTLITYYSKFHLHFSLS